MGRSDFVTSFIALNQCQASFERWCFEPGMRFGENEKWWTNADAPRGSQHEGVDFCCFYDRLGRRVWLKESTKVPALHDGYIAEIFDDFMGQSILVRHGDFENGRQLCSIYAHIVPLNQLVVGSEVRAGQCIGQCAPKKTVPVHLHLSIIQLTSSLRTISWPSLVKCHAEHFLDPLLYI